MLRKTLAKIYYQLPAKFSRLGYALPCRNVVFELTYNCNLKCRMCSYRNEINHTPEHMGDFSALETEESLNLLEDFPRGSNVTFTGGEIFTKKGVLQLIEAAAKLHKLSLATNGTLLSDDIAEKLVGWGIKLIGLSLDGPPDIHNEIRGCNRAYDRMLEAIHNLNRHKKRAGVKYPRLSLNGVILENNFSSLYKNLELASTLNIDTCTFQIYDPSWCRSGWRLNQEIPVKEDLVERVKPIKRKLLLLELEKLVNTAGKLNIDFKFVPQLTLEEIADYYDNKFDLTNWRCLQAWSTMRISPYGDVFPCINFNIGNIRVNKPATLWNNHNYRSFRKALARAGLFEICTGCCKMIRN
jgi:MoaA/NifB/PqqE/SkfB family radical SAM enzyme